MKRQRCLLASVAGGTSPTDLAVNYLGPGRRRRRRSGPTSRERLGDLVRVFSLVDVSGPDPRACAPGDQAVEPRRRPHPHAGREHTRRGGAAADPSIGAPSC